MTSPSLPASQIDIPEVVSQETGKLIKRGRIKNAAALNSCYQTFFNEDLVSSRKRARVQAAADNEPPYSEANDRLRGLEGRANINWGEMGDELQEACMPYNTVLESMDYFGSWKLDYQADPQTLNDWGQICAEEHARMLRSWPDFNPSWYQNSLIGVMEGLSFAMFEDQIDWRWKVVGQQFLKFPRRTRASVNWVDMFTCKVEMLPHELYNKCDAEDSLPDDQPRYWNKQAVIKALKTAAPQSLDSSDWQEWQRVWKDNDLTLGITNATVPVVHGFVRELDGTVSHYIAQYRADDDCDFLYKCEGKYENMSDLLNDYLFDVGTNGDFQSIRGLGYKKYSAIVGLNRLRNKALDAACHEATPYLTNSSEDALTDRMIQPMGPMVILDNQLQFAERPASNLSSSLMPVLGILGQISATKSAGYAPVAASGQSRTQKTKYQVEQESMQSSTLSGSRFTMFMTCWSRHYRNIVKRTVRKDYRPEDPGGQEVWKFLNRCIKRGVPLDAIRSVDLDSIEINTGIGKGSAANLQQVVSILDERLYARLDAEGRQMVDYLIASAYSNQHLARQLVPRTPGLRPPVDASFAQMENSVMAMGQPPAFEVNQNHVVHIQKHLERIGEINQQFIDGAIGIPEAVGQMQPIWEHAQNQHLPLTVGLPEHPAFKESLQQYGEFIVNGQKHLEAQRQREEQDALEVEEVAAVEQAPPAGLFASAVDAKARADAAKSEVELDGQRQRVIADAVKARQEAAARDIEIASKTVDLNQKVKAARNPAPEKP